MSTMGGVERTIRGGKVAGKEEDQGKEWTSEKEKRMRRRKIKRAAEKRKSFRGNMHRQNE